MKLITPSFLFSRCLTSAIVTLLSLIGFSLAPVTAADEQPTLAFSTYFGGSDSDLGINLAIDNNGNIYVTGVVGSVNFPATDPLGVGGPVSGFVTKFDPTGTTLLYSILLEYGGKSIAVDADGAAYVVGGGADAIITKINPAGTATVYSMHLGGTQDNHALAVAVDALKNAYVVGATKSIDFPTKDAYQDSFGGGSQDGWLAKINPAGTELVYSTYFGGTGGDSNRDIAVDSIGNAYITGSTGSTDFPVVNPYQAACVPSAPLTSCDDAFVAKFSPSGVLVYSTYLGGSGRYEGGRAIAIDSQGSAYITGLTNSADFPTTPNAYQSMLGAVGSAFITRLSPDGSSLIYSTYLGGTTDVSEGFGIAADGEGGVYVSGITSATDFPTSVNAIQPTNTGLDDAFFGHLNAAGQSLVYSTYFGGDGRENSGVDDSPRIVLDQQRGNLYIFGTTNSHDFPILNAFQDTLGGGSTPIFADAFLAKIDIPPVSLPAQAAERNYFTTDTPTLTWKQVTWALGYRVQVNKSQSFTPPYDFEGDALASADSIITDDLDNGFYYWRILAQKPDGSWGNVSPIDSFTIAVDD